MESESHKIMFFNDLFRLLTIFTMSRFLECQPLDKEWQLHIFHNVLGIMMYRQIINPANRHVYGTASPLIDDVIKTGIIITVASLLDNGSINPNLHWILVGVVIYHVLFQKRLFAFIKYFTGDSDMDVSYYEDWVEYFVIINLTIPFDRNWFPKLFYSIVSFALYHFIIKKATK